jgi:hypothetical protein
VFSTSVLRFLDRAELEHAAWIAFRGDGPVAGAVPQEASKSGRPDSGTTALFISSIERNFCTGMSALVFQIEMFSCFRKLQLHLPAAIYRACNFARQPAVGTGY